MQNIPTSNCEYGFEEWHQLTCRHFSVSECRQATTSPFRAQVSSRQFGPLVLSEVSSSGHEGVRMQRSLGEIRRDARDHFMFYLVLGGSVDLAQDEREVSATAGDLLLYDQTLPFTLQFQPHHAILVNIPRTLLVSLVPTARRYIARRIAGNLGIGALASSVVRQIADVDASACPAVESRLAISTVDIIGAALETGLGGANAQRSSRHRLLTQVERYILAHLHDSELDLAAIARAQNVAPRTLNRIFAAEGTTPIRWLWKQRLVASFRALSECQTDNVTKVAVSVGFTDMSHFSRAFKREFGLLPHEVQRTSRIRLG